MTLKALCSAGILIAVLGCSDHQDAPGQGIPIEPEPIGVFLDDWTYSVRPTIEDNFEIAEFRLWIPEAAENLKALLVVLRGSNTSSLGIPNDSEWQDYAVSERLGLVGINFKHYGNAEGHYADATNGSGDAMLKAIDTIMQRHDLNALRNLPLLMTGFSAGGVYSYYFAQYKPERVIGFTNIRGGAVGGNNQIYVDVPGLMLIGNNDLESRKEHMIDAVLKNRALNGNWGYAIEPEADHFWSLDNSFDLTKAYFSTLMPLRLEADGDALSKLKIEAGWLGDNDSKLIHAYFEYPKDKHTASWIVNADFGNSWRDYQLTN